MVRKIWLCVVLFLSLAVLPQAHAQEPALLVQAAQAWNQAELNKAAKLYEQALKQGGLYPADVLVAYARIGTVQAAMNKQAAALSAFRVAAALDPSFELPSEAGPKAKQLYKKARADAERQGGKLEIIAEIPTQSAPGAEFVVTAKMAESFVPLIVDVGITVQDPSIPSMKPWTTKKPADTTITFEVPGKVVVAGANLLVRVDALDAEGNRWASTQSRVKVDQSKAANVVTLNSDWGQDKPPEKKQPSKSFWKSPWPWVIGGAIVAGGVTTYFITRPGDDVTVAAPTWQ